MYTILIDDNDYMTSTVRERIIQRTKLTNTIRIIVSKEKNGYNMKDCTAILFYRSPISGEWNPKTLTPSEEYYKENYVEYLFQSDTWLTKEYGDVLLEVRFYDAIMTGDINVDQFVRKANGGCIHISRNTDWSSQIADQFLDVIDQRIIQTAMLQNRQDEMMQELADINVALADAVPDDLVLKDGKVYLSQNGQVMPNTVGVSMEGCNYEDGVPVVDFTVVEPEEPDESLVNNVVEF